MSADNTARIAAILGGHGEIGNDCRCGWVDDKVGWQPRDHTPYDAHLADVLVTGLGLTEDRHDWHDDAIRPTVTRYVTRWERTDD